MAEWVEGIPQINLSGFHLFNIRQIQLKVNPVYEVIFIPQKEYPRHAGQHHTLFMVFLWYTLGNSNNIELYCQLIVKH